MNEAVEKNEREERNNSKKTYIQKGGRKGEYQRRARIHLDTIRAIIRLQKI
jgi:hypothetical protein